ncbi:MAG TPA: aminoacyl-tRNA hydrolase [Gammaproteobacteria bacterium]|nr:aminoacyl-tRNA hydrolase [Gammaproteobacteria bacterium]
MSEAIELIVGLGNPGGEHLQDRHNAGFWLADLLARESGATFKRDKHMQAEITDVTIGTARVRLLKPQTYMNASGRAVTAALSFFKIPPERVLVAHDELDLEPGRAQLKFDGGHGGHNGLRDVVAHVGSQFWRLRLGIGHPGPGRKDEVVDYVLRRPTAEQLELMLEAIAAGIEALPVFLEQGPERAKTQLHSRGREPRPYRKPAAET